MVKVSRRLILDLAVATLPAVSVSPEMSQRGADFARAAAKQLPCLRSLLYRAPHPPCQPLPGVQQTTGTATQAASLTHRMFSSALHRPSISPSDYASRLARLGEGQTPLFHAVVQRHVVVSEVLLPWKAGRVLLPIAIIRVGLT